MTLKGKNLSFLDDDQWLNILAFLVDVTKYLANLNLKLQGKQFVSLMVFPVRKNLKFTIKKHHNPNVFLG